MPPLENRRHESFAQALFEGLSNGITQHDAYVSAGYEARGNSAKVNACRLLKSVPAIASRIRELQAEAARAKQTTIETVVDELEAARAIAEKNEQPSAMVSASMGKARILGLEAPQKSEVGRPGDFSRVETLAELADKLLGDLGGASKVTDGMRDMMVAELKRHVAAINAIAASDTVRGH
jgi:hypothetical protein